MTHTLHRRTPEAGEKDDFVILCMAAQKFNDKGAGEKLKKVYKIVAESNPDNLADDNLGGRCTGCTDEQILEHMGDKAYVGASFSDEHRLKKFLKDLKEADLGMSVVVSGNYKVVFELLKELDIRPHTVNMSLGIFGNKNILPKEEILSVSTMCGHGMVSVKRIENTIDMVKTRELTPEEGGLRLASTCTCGIFNPVIASRLLKNA